MPQRAAFPGPKASSAAIPNILLARHPLAGDLRPEGADGTVAVFLAPHRFVTPFVTPSGSDGEESPPNH
jgi:hypothetical protein